jgi:histidine kinase
VNLLATIRQRMGWKIFLSNLVIVAVGVIVLWVTAEVFASAALAGHVASMRAVLGDNPALVANLDASFRAAVNQVLLVAALAAMAAAAVVSTFVAQRIVGPVQAMMEASRRIAAGDYHERVNVPGDDELGALAHSFNRMAETLERTEQRRLELIGNVAHELRTPLTSIKGVMEGLADGVLPADAATFLSVQREVSRLQRLVHDLEELSRVEAGQVPLDLQPVSIADVIRPVADRLRPQFEDKEVTLQVEVAPDLPPVWADRGRITQVLVNLVGNALQYTPPGGQVTIQASVSEQRPAEDGHPVAGGWLLITISDTGIGIPPEHLPHIFERFYRVDRSRSRAGGGSGIGLTIAKHLVETHGGRIWAKSAGAGQGSTFSFTLPLAGPSPRLRREGQRRNT